MKSPERGQAIGQNSEKPNKKTSLQAPPLWWRRPAGTAARATAALLIAGSAAFLTDMAPQEASSAVSPRSNHQIQAVTDSPPNPIYFDSSLGSRKWYYYTRWGIPPNNPDIDIGTMDDSVNNTGYWIIINQFQLLQTDYPKQQDGSLSQVIIDGVIVDPAATKALMLIAVWWPGNRYTSMVQGIADVNNPTDHAGWRVYQDVLPQDGAMGEPFSSVGWHTDDQGLSVDIGLKNSVTPSNDGLWRCALNSGYEIIGRCIKIEPFRNFLPFVRKP